MCLLMTPALAGPVIFGAVRIWSIVPLLVLFLAGAAWTALRFATGSRRLPDALVIPPGGLWWGPLLAYLAVRIPFSVSPQTAVFEWSILFSYAAAYWLWAQPEVTWHSWKRMMAVVMVLLSLIALYALVEYFRALQDPLRQTPIQVLWREGKYELRVSGTYICPNHFAALIEIGICFSTAILFLPGAGAILRLLAGYGLLLFLPAMLLTQSRSGWLGSIAGLSTVGLLLLWRKNRKLFFLGLFAIPVLTAAVGVGIWFLSPMVQERVADALSGNIRTHIWADTWDLIRDKPWVGFGGGSFRYVFPRYITKVFANYLRYAHNDYLHFAAEYGVVGFFLMAAFALTALVGFLKLAFSAKRATSSVLAIGAVGAVAANLVHAVFDYNLQYFSNNHVLFLLAGVTVGLAARSGESVPAVRSARRAHRAGAGAAALLCLLAIAVSSAIWLSDFWGRRGRDRIRRFDYDAGERIYRRALAVDPLNWNVYTALGDAYRQRARWDRDPAYRVQYGEQALRHYEKALELNPYDVKPRYGMAEIDQVLGRDEEALAILEHIVRDVPGFAFYHVQLGLHLRTMGRTREALERFQKAQALEPEAQVIRMNVELLKKKLRAETP
jgi:O-antigen ligase/Flp pilus assembly protein TadD